MPLTDTNHRRETFKNLYESEREQSLYISQNPKDIHQLLQKQNLLDISAN